MAISSYRIWCSNQRMILILVSKWSILTHAIQNRTEPISEKSHNAQIFPPVNPPPSHPKQFNISFWIRSQMSGVLVSYFTHSSSEQCPSMARMNNRSIPISSQSRSDSSSRMRQGNSSQSQAHVKISLNRFYINNMNSDSPQKKHYFIHGLMTIPEKSSILYYC